ncbi:hypothetical protein [[Mycoplasma] imitans]|uniref:hypothetical protein n=1 Tax=[Mycoplasma] imitans TaxID=29560 RepID=UPI000688F63B|nr:hypothetical protein [[Mycoplasma] imitans]
MDSDPGKNGSNKPETQLEVVRTNLNNLLNNQNSILSSYDDYAKLKKNLSDAYAAATTVKNNQNANLETLNSAISTLEKALNTASSNRTNFNNQNTDLVQTYGSIKANLNNMQATLQDLQGSNYDSIRNYLNGLFESAQKIITNTLIPTDDANTPNLQNLQTLNTDFTTYGTQQSIRMQKESADNLVNNGFQKYALTQNGLSGVDQEHSQPQPCNYGFGAYSVNIGDGTTTGQSTTPPTQSILNYSYFRRNLWSTDTTIVTDQTDLTDVSWIYGLFGSGAKYSFTFNYYGPTTTGYLYFPYKLVKTGDSVALQYKLNNSNPISIDFSGPATNPTQTATGSSDAGAASASGTSPSGSAGSGASANTPASTSMVNPTPTVSNINVATLMLTGLKYGSNTIEFSLPADAGTKVAPMIGNMYISSTADAKNKVYDSIFGNNPSTDNNSIAVNFVTGYSLAADYSTYMGQYTNTLANVPDSVSTRYFLVSYVGGTSVRGGTDNAWYQNGMNAQKAPSNTNDQRTFSFYVNAPKTGNYSIKGVYYTAYTRGLFFSVEGGTTTNNSLNINNLLSSTATNGVLRQFDTSQQNGSNNNRQSISNSALSFSQTSLPLTKGLNKIIVKGNSSNINDINKETPYFGNLTFTYVPETTSQSSSSQSGSSQPAGQPAPTPAPSQPQRA